MQPLTKPLAALLLLCSLSQTSCTHFPTPLQACRPLLRLDRSDTMTPDQRQARDEEDIKSLENGQLPPVVVGIKCHY